MMSRTVIAWGLMCLVAGCPVTISPETEIKQLREDLDTPTWLIQTVRGRPDEPSEERVAAWVDAVSADVRAAAAALLGKRGDAGARKTLKGMLTDPDAVVRRVAAESLFGESALRKGTAKRHGYEEVLAAEKEARRLAEGIRRGDRAEQYRATRRLIALGRPVAWGLRGLRRNDNATVVLSAYYASKEIAFAHPNVPPAWVGEIERKLEKKVSFDFRDRPFTEAVRTLSGLSGIKIKLYEEASDVREEVNLRVTNMPMKLALAWAVKLFDCEFVIRDGAVVVEMKRFVCGTTLALVDVRDLEAGGLRPDWAKLFNTEVFPDYKWVGAADAFFVDHNGLLAIWVPSCNLHRPFAGRKRLEPILAYLDKRRREMEIPVPRARARKERTE